MPRGRPPKPVSQLVGHGAAKARLAATRVLEARVCPQPELPEVMPTGGDWPEQTVDWWDMWGESPLSAEFTANDWAELLDAALLHARLWGLGDVKVAAELRQRMANFGATPADRARLRIQFATADTVEAKAPKPVSSARDRRGPLTA